MAVVIQGYLLPIMNYVAANKSKIEPIYFQMTPAISSDSKSANFESVAILGRAEPVRIYKNSNARTLKLDLTYAAVDKTKFNFKWVSNQVARLRALVYPYYSRNQKVKTVYVPPPLVLLNYGMRFVNVPCVVTNISVSYGSVEDEMMDENMLPMLVKVGVDLEVSYAYNYVPGYQDVDSMFVDDSGMVVLSGETFDGKTVTQNFTLDNSNNPAASLSASFGGIRETEGEIDAGLQKEGTGK